MKNRNLNLFMAFMLVFMAPFANAISYVDDPAGGGGDPEPTEAEKKLVEVLESKLTKYVTADDLKTLKEEYITEQVKLLQDQLDEVKENTGSELFKKEIDKLQETMQKQIDEAGVEIEKLSITGGNTKQVTFKSLIAEALEHEDYKEFIDRGHKGSSKGIDIDMKDVSFVGFVADVVTPQRRGPEVAFLGPKKFDIRTILFGGTSDVDVIDHLIETGFANNEGFLAENAESVESTTNLEQKKTTSVRLATHVDVSKKALRNVSFLTNYLTNRFNEQMAETLTDSIINGDGTGDTVNGLFNNATVFTPGSLANSVEDANTADTISAAICRLAEITNLQATAILMNPKDVFGLKVTKDTTGDYVESAIIVTRVDGQLFIDGVPVFQTFHIATDKYLVADMSATAVEWYETQGLTMNVSESHDKNFIKNMVTFSFEIEGLLPIYKTFASLKGTISTDKLAIGV